MERSKNWSSASRWWGRGRGKGETGSAALEFLTAGFLLLVPLVYLVVSLSVVQAGALAVEGAARQAARVYVQAPTETVAVERATRAVEFGLADYGLKATDATVRVACTGGADGCLTRESGVTVTVSLSVALPLIPDVLSLRGAASIPLQGTATQIVSRFREDL
ncbi:hypothetical protein D6T64_10610 [Cryobacterium melibiosiphilum]|uniref:TadE family protein n=1 Tax=Cryobacterium melibiosiphilum TaxID=995039 RepID=A0A3A5MMI5_9MICO|nr:hypothetical protein [Cryobacterium melibiosiphilum]RJT88338.1 hypothetical protein D6T64_10610 [Cryobacterium melibiosiphilum]